VSPAKPLNEDKLDRIEGNYGFSSNQEILHFLTKTETVERRCKKYYDLIGEMPYSLQYW
jgi:hypothetical protein